MVDVPNFDLGVGGGGEEQMARSGKEVEGGYGFGVGVPGMDVFRGYKVLRTADIFSQVYT